MRKIRVSIAGTTGYTGAELLRLLVRHPHVELAHLASSSAAGKRVSDVHPFLEGHLNAVLETPRPDRIGAGSDVTFLALPAGEAMRWVTPLLGRGCRVVDLSADFRHKDPSVYRKLYGLSHKALAHLKSSVYGLPELDRAGIARAQVVANPGCYATAAILALAPVVKAGWADGSGFIVDAKSGVSGAGRKLEAMYLYSEANESMTPYAVARHRHGPEMETALGRAGRRKVLVTFTPQLAPMTRGILSISYARLRRPVALEAVRKGFERFYEDSRFIRVLPTGRMPSTRDVLHTNFCDIGLALDARTKTLIIASALDNLVKGASGQAVQNMNLMFGLPETEGLL